MRSVPPKPGNGDQESANDWLIRESEAYVRAQEVIALIEDAAAMWRVEGWTVGQFLTLIVSLGPQASRAMDKGWNFLYEGVSA